MNGRLNVYPTCDALAEGAAEHVALLLSTTVRSRARAMIALSGGETPRRLYALLASERFRESIPWAHVHVFWGDERCVPPDHPDSNFRMANDVLLRHVMIPDTNVHRIQGELAPDRAARSYEEELRRVFAVDPDNVPQFDLIILGLGGDGHTASLFPGTVFPDGDGRLALEVFLEKLDTHRVTLTYSVINHASHIVFLVSGAGKAAILADVLQGKPGVYPAQKVRPHAGELQWMVDRDAASQLEKVRHV